MKFSLVQYTSDEITSKSEMITSISKDIEVYLEKKDYGSSINTIFIGVICVNPQFEQFFQPRQKYTKSKKMLEYSIVLDFELFKSAMENKAIEILVQRILNSIIEVVEKFSINDFNIEQYKRDLKQLFKEKRWIND